MDFAYQKGEIADRAVFIVGESVTTSIFNQVYGAALLADRWTQKSTNMDGDPDINYFAKHNIKDVYRGESLTGVFGTESVSDDDGDSDTMFTDGATRVTSTSATSEVSVGGQTTAISEDLSEFPDGSASSDDDYILFSFVVNDISNWGYIGIRIGPDSSNYYYKYPSISGMVSGVNHYRIKKSEFSVTGTPTDWSSIGYLIIRAYGATGVDTTGEWLTLQSLQLVRNDGADTMGVRQLPDSTGTLYYPYGSPLNYQSLRQGFGKPIGYTRLKSDTASEIFVFNDKLVNTFYSEMLQYIAYDSNSVGLSFKIDTDNYIQCYVSSDTFYMDIYESGSLASSTNQALTNGIKRHENIRISLEKESTTLRAELTAHGEAILLYGSTTLLDEGTIVANQPTSSSLGVVTGFTVSNERKKADMYPQLVRQRNYVDLTTLANTEMSVFLEPNGVYEINAVAVLKGDIAGSVITDWDYDGDITQVIYRACNGLGVGETDETAAVIRKGAHNLATNVTYGLSTTNANYTEYFIVSTGPLGGRLTWRVGSTTSTVTVNGLGSVLAVNKFKS